MVDRWHDELVSLKDELLEQLRPHGQEGVLQFWDELSQLQKMTLATQLAQCDLGLIRRLFRQKHQPDDWGDTVSNAKPPQAIRLHQPGKFSAVEARSRGAAALSAGRIGAILVAGGQGTRLGFEHPKGMFPIGPVSQASLFQILFEKLIATGQRYGKACPLFLMTSPATHDETTEYLAEHARFGFDPDDLIVCPQGTMPAVNATTGDLLLSDKSQLCLSPDGHGGVLAAMSTAGAFERLLARGIEHLFYFQVDNPLAPVCDPALIGYHLLAQAEATTMAVAKTSPRDPVGNIVELDGRQRIVEYSEFNHLDDELIAQRDASGLRFWAGNTAIHIFDLRFLQRMASDGGQLPFHVARKRVPHVSAAGHEVEPTEPNALKFERFVFDLLPAAQRSLVVEVDQQQAFAPLKNAPGSPTDSPESVRAQMIALHQAWLRAAGARFAPEVAVEISPLFALDQAAVAQRIEPGTRIDAPRYFT